MIYAWWGGYLSYPSHGIGANVDYLLVQLFRYDVLSLGETSAFDCFLRGRTAHWTCDWLAKE